MNTLTSGLASAGTIAAPSRKPLPGWLREPLLHFLVLGALLFAIDHALSSRAEDPRRIVISAEVDDETRQLFHAARGRDPDAAELAALRQRWLDEEVLYREGLALGVDRGDKAIRDRVIFKSLSVIDAGLKLPPYDDATLRGWFETQRAKYDEPTRFDFEEAVLAGHPTDAQVAAFVAELNGGLPGDAQAGLRVFKGRPHASLEQSYGAEFVLALQQSRAGTWRALPSRGGMKAIRLNSVLPAKPARYEVVRNIVVQDWTDATMAEQRTATVRALAKKYSVTYQGAAQ
jgi:hypothetical protein